MRADNLTGGYDMALPVESGQDRTMKIALASDHAGFHLKQTVSAHLASLGHAVVDLGTSNDGPVDYPHFCAAAGRSVVRGEADLAIVMGGSGQGEAIAANKVRGVRAALCHDEYTARFARLHNDANVLSLGARILGEALALAVIDVFLATEFEGGRHQPRIDQIVQIEDEEAG